MLHLCNSVHMMGKLYICHFLARPNKLALESEIKTILFTSTSTRRTQRICYHLQETRQHIQHKVVLLCTQVDKHVTGVQSPPSSSTFFFCDSLSKKDKHFPSCFPPSFPILHYLPPINPLNTKLNPICHLLAILEAHHILHVSKIRINNAHLPYVILYIIFPFSVRSPLLSLVV
jgi:hypothetical protein